VVYKNMTNSIIAALAQRIPELEAIVGRALLMLLLGYRRPRMLPKRHNTLRLPHFFGRALTPHFLRSGSYPSSGRSKGYAAGALRT